MKLEGKQVVITGASSGIGLELAKLAAARKANVTLIARRADRLEAVAADCREHGVKARVIQADLSLEADCRRAIAQSVEGGGIDLLILNAGISHRCLASEETDWSVFSRLMQTNYLGAVYCTLAALPELKLKRATIAVVSSLQGKTGFPRTTAYSASKHALHGFFDSLRLELHDTGIKILLACPGPVESEIRDEGSAKGDPSSLMPAAECARQILDAAERGDRELWMTAAGKFGAYLRPFFPDLIDSIVRKKVAKFYGQ